MWNCDQYIGKEARVGGELNVKEKLISQERSRYAKNRLRTCYGQILWSMLYFLKNENPLFSFLWEG